MSATDQGGNCQGRGEERVILESIGKIDIDEHSAPKQDPTTTHTSSRTTIDAIKIKDVIVTIKVVFGSPRRLPLKGVPTIKRQFKMVDTPAKALDEVNKEEAMIDNLEIMYNLDLNNADGLKGVYLTFTGKNGKRCTVHLSTIWNNGNPFHTWKDLVESGQLLASLPCDSASNPNIHGPCPVFAHGPEIHIYMKNDIKVAKRAHSLQYINEWNQTLIKDLEKDWRDMVAIRDHAHAMIPIRDKQIKELEARIAILEDERKAL